jgi:hypothetical protein
MKLDDVAKAVLACQLFGALEHASASTFRVSLSVAMYIASSALMHPRHSHLVWYTFARRWMLNIGVSFN